MSKKIKAKNTSAKAEVKKTEAVAKVNAEYILLALIMILVTAVRLRLLSFPLERDEGEYAYMGSLLLDGIPPYKEAYNMKFPGTYFMYAISMLIFGKTIQGIHLGLLCANLTTIYFLYRFVKKLINGDYAVLAAAIFAITSISVGVMGYAGHATNFVVLAAVAGLFLTYSAYEKNNLISFLLAGFVIGCAPVMKQPGIFFPLAGGVLLFCLWLQERELSKIRQHALQLFIYIAGGILPVLLVVVYLLVNGVWSTFAFWAIEYVFDYGSQIPASQAMEAFKYNFQAVFSPYKLLWILFLPGVVAAFFIKNFRFKALFILALTLLSLAALSVGFYFRPHYFIMVLPAVSISFAALLYGVELFFTRITKAANAKYVKWVAFGLIAVIGIWHEYDYLFKESTSRLCKAIYVQNPFLESQTIGRFIKQNTEQNDRIAIIGSEPQLFFYSGRKSATGYIYTYGLMEIHKNNLRMQKEMASEIEKNKPAIMVMVNVPLSWLRRPESPSYIFEWFDKYLYENKYTAIGLMEMGSDGSNFITGPELKTHQPQPVPYIVVFKKGNG